MKFKVGDIIVSSSKHFYGRRRKITRVLDDSYETEVLYSGDNIKISQVSSIIMLNRITANKYILDVDYILKMKFNEDLDKLIKGEL